MRFHSLAIDGICSNGNLRDGHHDGHGVRPPVGRDPDDSIFYVTILMDILSLCPKDDVERGRRRRTAHMRISSNDASKHISNITSISTAASGFHGPSLCGWRPSLAAARAGH